MLITRSYYVFHQKCYIQFYLHNAHHIKHVPDKCYPQTHAISFIVKLQVSLAGDNCHVRSPTLSWAVIHNPKDGQPSSQQWSPSFQRTVTHHNPDGQSPFTGWSPTIPRMVTHHLKYSHPPRGIGNRSEIVCRYWEIICNLLLLPSSAPTPTSAKLGWLCLIAKLSPSSS